MPTPATATIPMRDEPSGGTVGRRSRAHSERCPARTPSRARPRRRTPTSRAATCSRPTRFASDPRTIAADEEPGRTTSTTKPAARRRSGSPSMRPRKTRARAEAEASGAASRPLGIRQPEQLPYDDGDDEDGDGESMGDQQVGSSVEPTPYSARDEHARPDRQHGPGAQQVGGRQHRGHVAAPARRRQRVLEGTDEVLSARGRPPQAGPGPRPWGSRTPSGVPTSVSRSYSSASPTMSASTPSSSPVRARRHGIAVVGDGVEGTGQEAQPTQQGHPTGRVAADRATSDHPGAADESGGQAGEAEVVQHPGHPGVGHGLGAAARGARPWRRSARPLGRCGRPGAEPWPRPRPPARAGHGRAPLPSSAYCR